MMHSRDTPFWLEILDMHNTRLISWYQTVTTMPGKLKTKFPTTHAYFHHYFHCFDSYVKHYTGSSLRYKWPALHFLFWKCLHGIKHSRCPKQFFLCNAASVIPARSLGFTSFGEIFASVTVFLSCNWGSHIPSSWMVYAGCILLLVFNLLEHEQQDLLILQDWMHPQTTTWFWLSSQRDVGIGVRANIGFKEKKFPWPVWTLLMATLTCGTGTAAPATDGLSVSLRCEVAADWELFPARTSPVGLAGPASSAISNQWRATSNKTSGKTPPPSAACSTARHARSSISQLCSRHWYSALWTCTDSLVWAVI